MRSLKMFASAAALLAAVSCCETPTSPSLSAGGVTTIVVTGKTQLQISESTNLKATATYADGSQQDVTAVVSWSSDNGGICTVNGKGIATGKSGGTCTASAVLRERTGRLGLSILVPNPGGPGGPGDPTPNPPTDPGGPGAPSLAGLSLSGPATVNFNSTVQWQAIANFSDGSQQTVTGSANWSSNTTSIATVNGGAIFGASAGSAGIVATYQGFTASGIITVTGGGGSDPTVVSLAITGNTSLQVGGTTQLQAVATLSNGQTQTVTSAASWSSGSPTIATVSGGLVTGISNGQSVITANYGGRSAQATVTVSGSTNPTVISLSVSGNSNLVVGGTSQLTATAHLSDGTTQNVTNNASWFSGTTANATVNGTGLVTGVAAGTSVITATYSGRQAQLTVTVSNAGPTRQLIGLEAQVIVDGGTVLTGNSQNPINLSLHHLLNGNPILNVKVFGLYNDGTKDDVTTLAAIDVDQPLLQIDGMGTVQVIALLLQGLINPNHYVNVTYGGFTANVVVVVNLPVLQSLGLGNGAPIVLTAGNQLPALVALFSQGITSNVDLSVPAVYQITLADGLLTQLGNVPIVGPLLIGPLTSQINQVLAGASVVNGVLTLTPQAQTVLNSVLGNQLFSAIGLNVLPIDIRATVNGVTSNPLRVHLGGS